MLKSLFVMAFAIFGMLSTAQADMKPLAQTDKPIIARFTADWCSNCKILEPKFQEALGRIKDKDSYDLVVLDFTDDMSKAKSAAKAGETGLTDLYNELAPKTGMAVLVKDGEEVVRITKDDSVDVIQAKLETFIALH